MKHACGVTARVRALQYREKILRPMLRTRICSVKKVALRYKPPGAAGGGIKNFKLYIFNFSTKKYEVLNGAIYFSLGAQAGPIHRKSTGFCMNFYMGFL